MFRTERECIVMYVKGSNLQPHYSVLPVTNYTLHNIFTRRCQFVHKFWIKFHRIRFVVLYTIFSMLTRFVRRSFPIWIRPYRVNSFYDCIVIWHGQGVKMLSNLSWTVFYRCISGRNNVWSNPLETMRGRGYFDHSIVICLCHVISNEQHFFLIFRVIPIRTLRNY